ncbi:MAG: hypothetical protein IPP12_22225 [Nitrospira sp.]|nr:hypothetical protein [Nitrospira sp.]MBK9949853.1 hypothetical protein [Nitrospira sp.]
MKLSKRLATISEYDGATAVSKAVEMAQAYEARTGWRSLKDDPPQTDASVFLRNSDGRVSVGMGLTDASTLAFETQRLGWTEWMEVPE